jgi:hypothetical protein
MKLTIYTSVHEGDIAMIIMVDHDCSPKGDRVWCISGLLTETIWKWS